MVTEVAVVELISAVVAAVMMTAAGVEVAEAEAVPGVVVAVVMAVVAVLEEVGTGGRQCLQWWRQWRRRRKQTL